jgi:alpha-1,2-mannosyltransferase
VVVVIGAILADGRSPRRVAIAAGTAAFFALTIPWWGRSLLGQHDVPVLAARVVEDAFGIAAVALVVIVARLPPAERRDRPAVLVDSGRPGLRGPRSGRPPRRAPW